MFKSKYVKQVIKIGERVHHDEKHVLLCCSKGYIKRGGVTLTSVILSNQDMHFTFHIVCDDIVDDDLTKIKATCEKFKTNIILYILEENIINKLRVAVNETMHCTVAAFFRIIGFDILSESFDRVLCLDSDIIVVGSIEEFWNINLNGRYGVVVKDVLGDKLKQTVNVGSYFNSGVILVNLEIWRRKKLTELCINNILKEKYTLMDQDALNVVFDKKCIYLNKNYNFMWDLWKSASSIKNVNDISEGKIKGDIRIIHYASRTKPWCSWVQFLPSVKRYMDFQKLSLWSDNELFTPYDEKDKRSKYHLFRQQAKIAYNLRQYRNFAKLIIEYFKLKLYYCFSRL